MLSLHSQDIVNLYVWVDDLLPKAAHPQGGRYSLMTDSELVTLLIWNAVVVHQHTIKDIYRWARLYHRREFPRLPQYNSFLEHCHRVTVACLYLLQQLLCWKAPLKIMDSTMVPVCTLDRAATHRVAKRVARFGKNYQGWHYGFKLHVSIDAAGRLCGFVFSPANSYDSHAMPLILNRHTKVAVGDSHYGASVMCRKIWEAYGTVILTPPHYKQHKKLATPWQIDLLNSRSKIESVFDYLKQHLHLVTSFPRSVLGYLVHYTRILLAYQLTALASV
jgi:hypothetical protein